MNADRFAQLAAARRCLGRASGVAHLMGIGGVGVAGVARLLLGRGWRVGGCDLAENRLTRDLAARGATIFRGHDAAHVPADGDWLIHTAAVPPAHPEILAARNRGAAVTCRGAALAALLEGRSSIAVAGTHGKTTTTAMLAQILRRAGFDPGHCIGGEVDALGGVAAPGGGRWLVVEADESDGTLELYAPDIAVVTNVDYDHMEHFAGESEFFAVFERFIVQTTGAVVYGADHPVARRLTANHPRAIGFGFAPDAAVRADRWRSEGFGQVFELLLDARPAGELRLPVPGRYNALNALAALAAARAAGADLDAARAALADYAPARRRLDFVCAARGATIYADYAHHPAEIRALLGAAADLPHERLLAIFQPHRYTRTRALAADFPPAFDGLAELVLTPVYAASEAPLEGGTSDDLLRRFAARSGGPAVTLAASLEDAWSTMRARLRPGDLLLIVGAGDVEKIADWARRDSGKAGTS